MHLNFKKENRNIILWLDLIMMLAGIIGFLLAILSIEMEWSVYLSTFIIIFDLSIELFLFVLKLHFKHKLLLEQELKGGGFDEDTLDRK